MPHQFISLAKHCNDRFSESMIKPASSLAYYLEDFEHPSFLETFIQKINDTYKCDPGTSLYKFVIYISTSFI